MRRPGANTHSRNCHGQCALPQTKKAKEKQ